MDQADRNIDRGDPDEMKHPEPPEGQDPAADAAGSRRAGTGLGAGVGAAAGASIGAAAGPVGAAAGTAVGALGGALFGRAVAGTIDPTAEDEYWSTHYAERPYVEVGTEYDLYRPAYCYGWESYARYGSQFRTFDEVDATLAREWEERVKGPGGWPWSRARSAARDAWERLASRAATPGRDAGSREGERTTSPE
jgi:hypothetical protein